MNYYESDQINIHTSHTSKSNFRGNYPFIIPVSKFHTPNRYNAWSHQKIEQKRSKSSNSSLSR